MRRLHVLCAAGVAATLAFSALPAAAETGFDAAVEATTGVLGYYTFTGTSQANSVVNGYTGVLQNGASVGGPGPFSGATSLVLDNGASGTAYATAGGSNPLLGGIANEGSIVAWINLASLPSQYGRIYSIAGESEFGNDFDFQIENDQLRLYTDGGSFTGFQLTGAAVGDWLFVAGVFTGGVSRSLYVDGALVASGVPGNHTANAAPFYVGQSNVFGNRYFDGLISDVAVFDRALSADEVAGLYAAATTTAPGVPEPATWMMLIAGFGLAGAGLRARHGSSRPVTA